MKSRAPHHSATVPKLGASGWNQLPADPAHRTLVAVAAVKKSRLLILMSFERMVLALGVEPSPCSDLERSGL
jgi:hypothetical protein